MFEALVAAAAVTVLAIIVVLVAAWRKPATFRVQRSAFVQAPPDRVFPLVSDFHQWAAWSPWEKMDPDLKRTYSGSASGVGAVYEWSGNKKVGQGRMEITDATAPSRVAIQLDFIKPFEAHNAVELLLTGRDGGTDVSWGMEGGQPFLFKVMTLVMDMDRMIGKEFETGLANLKALAESGGVAAVG